MFYSELKTKTCYYGINPLCRCALVFEGSQSKSRVISAILFIILSGFITLTPFSKKAYFYRYAFLILCVTIVNNPMKKRSIYYLVGLLLSLIAFFYSIFFTNPKNLPVFMLLVPVVSIFLILFLIFYWLIRKSIFSCKTYSVNRSMFLAAIFSVIPVLLLVLASTRQFTFRDVCLSLILFLFIVIYFSRVDFLVKK